LERSSGVCKRASTSRIHERSWETSEGYHCCGYGRYDQIWQWNIHNKEKQSKTKAARLMKSFTPLSVTIRILDDPSEQNKAIRNYVNQYVAKLQFKKTSQHWSSPRFVDNEKTPMLQAGS
jgi:hypothetical protein